ncbi:hypothetical protein ACJIZ3_017453 [Penstemon smallii]|uniref:Uncharacterized protein n=1 Tax=Penstemon smallii TaxID=265156 RepID=A0ABD3SVK7_9LAMI
MRAKYAAMDSVKKASLLAKKRLQRASRLLPAASSSSASIIPLAPPSLSEAVPFARSAPHVLADVQVPRPLVLDDHARRSARNEKARARYATMNPNKKAEFLAKQRHKRSLLRSSPNLVASMNNVPAPAIQCFGFCYLYIKSPIQTNNIII